MINNKIKITIDSNLINARQKDEVLNELENMFKRGIIEIVGSQRLFDEMNTENRLKKAQNYQNISEPFVLCKSRIGYAYISCNEKQPSFEELSDILFPSKKITELAPSEENDIMHLIAHAHSDSDYFVTRNTKDFIDAKRTNINKTSEDLKNQKREKLLKLGIKVKTPEEILKIILNQINHK